MRILLLEDEPEMASALKAALERRQVIVDHVSTMADAEAVAELWPYDVVVLDRRLPDGEGLNLIPKLRNLGVAAPILMLTALGSINDRVAGLDAGADDYVAKPFHVEEVLARIRALIRRAAGHASSEIVCGPVRLDTKGSKATVDGVALKLTSHEFRLLSYLMHHMGQVVSRTELVEHMYDQDFDRDSNTIEVFIGRLRKKIGNDLIETVRGLGYRMQAPGNGN